MNQDKIDRINTLYHKSQSVGLTEEEKEEQKLLRKEYIEAIRRLSLIHIFLWRTDRVDVKQRAKGNRISLSREVSWQWRGSL